MSALNLDDLVERHKAYLAKVKACPHDFTGRSMHGDGPTCTKCGVLELAWHRRRSGELQTQIDDAVAELGDALGYLRHVCNDLNQIHNVQVKIKAAYAALRRAPR